MKSNFYRVLLTIFIVLSCAVHVRAQFSIGHSTITFNDPMRSGGFGSGGGIGRQIQTEIYYPSISAGEDVSLAEGEFPLVVIGHGFVMSWDAYQNIWQLLVAEGYIVALPRTEGGFSPSHSDFGLDLAQVLDKMFELGDNVSSVFFNKISGTGAIMGHSMGGGSSFLAGVQTDNVTAIVGLAPAETNPSAITEAANLTVPVLIFSGSEDAVTPAQDHHLPIYNSANSECKYFINIIGGGHCYFANPNTNCDFGELVSGLPSISRSEQQSIMNQYLLPWLNWWLKNDQQEAQEFQTLLSLAANVTYQENCVLLEVADLLETPFSLFPNPVKDHVTISLHSLASLSNVEISVLAIDGRLVNSIQLSSLNSIYTLGVSNLESGVYHVRVNADEGQWISRFLKTN